MDQILKTKCSENLFWFVEKYAEKFFSKATILIFLSLANWDWLYIHAFRH